MGNASNLFNRWAPSWKHTVRKKSVKIENQLKYTNGVEWKSYVDDISMKYDFHSNSSVNIHWNNGTIMCATFWVRNKNLLTYVIHLNP